METKGHKAVIFDCDGLLLDTESIYRQCYFESCKDIGLSFPEKTYDLFYGRRSDDVKTIFLDTVADEVTFKRLMECWHRRARQHIDRHGIDHKLGSLEIIDLVQRNNVPSAIATSSQQPWAGNKMKMTGLSELFDVIVTGDQVKHGKPSPYIFLETASRLKVDPSNVIVFEDSEAGIKAAHAAGMTPVMIPDFKQPTDEVREHCHGVYDSLADCHGLLSDLIDGFQQ